jgi:hypothetical protein
MAANTLFGGVFVVLIGVAEFAVKIPVFTGQWIVGIQVMIEILFQPALFVMTFIALFTQFTPMGVIRLMTIEAERGGLAIFLVIISMAELADKLLMAAA